jgi:uncharacterized protein (DUF433 family)
LIKNHFVMESNFITLDPEILWGIPVSKGTRVPIKNLFDYLKTVDSIEVFQNPDKTN